MTSLPATLGVHPDRGIIGLYGDQVDTFDHVLVGSRTTDVLVSNDYEAYIRLRDTPDPVTLHFTPAAPTDHDEHLGHATIELPTGQLVVSEITRGAHGPYQLADGPGIYTLTLTRRTNQGAPENQPTDLWLQLNRTGDPTPDEEDNYRS